MLKRVCNEVCLVAIFVQAADVLDMLVTAGNLETLIKLGEIRVPIARFGRKQGLLRSRLDAMHSPLRIILMLELGWTLAKDSLVFIALFLYLMSTNYLSTIGTAN